MTQINKVRISAAFCQFIWMLCYATYIKVESDIIHTEYERLSEEERLQFDSELQQNTIFNAIPQELQLSPFSCLRSRTVYKEKTPTIP